MRRAERLEVGRERVRLAQLGEASERVAHRIGELASVDVERGAVLARHDRDRERERRVRDVAAADVEGPARRMRVGDDERVGLELGELGADALELVRGRLAGELLAVQRDGAERRRRPVGPHRVDRIGLGRDQDRARRRAGLGEPLGALDGVQPRVVAELLAFAQRLLDPLVERRVGQVHDLEQAGVDLLARLQRVAAVDEQRRAVGEHDGAAGRAGEAGDPGEPLVGRRHVFVLVAVGARHDEAVETLPAELGAQRRDARAARGSVGGLVERLKASRHGADSIWAGPGSGNGRHELS